MSKRVSPMKVGDIVELLPTNQRNRQLRKQDGKKEWVIRKIDPDTICFGRNEGFLIEACVDQWHSRWVERTEIKVIKFAEDENRE